MLELVVEVVGFSKVGDIAEVVGGAASGAGSMTGAWRRRADAGFEVIGAAGGGVAVEFGRGGWVGLVDHVCVELRGSSAAGLKIAGSCVLEATAASLML